MTFAEFQSTRHATNYVSYEEQDGFMYQGGGYILQLPDGTYRLPLGGDDHDSPDLEVLEKRFWECTYTNTEFNPNYEYRPYDEEDDDDY